jgi:hypothetical protein
MLHQGCVKADRLHGGSQSLYLTTWQKGITFLQTAKKNKQV